MFSKLSFTAAAPRLDHLQTEIQDDARLNGSHPVLITGSMRSGTSWVGSVLRACPGTMTVLEPFNPGLSRRAARVCSHTFEHWFTYVTDENAAHFRRPISRMLELRHDTLDQFRRSRNVHDVVKVAAEGLRFALFRRAGRIPIMKDPVALFSAEWLAREFGARVVVSIRHPAAVVSSYKRLGWAAPIDALLQQPMLMRDLLAPLRQEILQHLRTPGDAVDRIAMFWKILYFVVRGYQQRHPDWLFIRHEDLSRDPAAGFETICRKTGLKFTEKVRRAALNSNDATLAAELDVAKAFTTRRNSLANLEIWKSRLTPEEIDRIRECVEEVSRHFYSDADW